MDVPLDKLSFLQRVSIFAGVPAQALTDLSAVVEELSFKTGAAIFHKGDLGDSLYIIADGEVRVHDGERTLNTLSAGDIFGEMSALDPEVRSASVTVMRDARLFRLGRAPLFQGMAVHVEVAQAIIQVLTQRARGSIREMHEDFEYIQQVAKVTNAAMAVEAGDYHAESLDDVAKRTDALGQLARVFQRMAREVYAREERLKQQVAELHIEIDKAKSARQVAELTETEYFQQLSSKARALRTKNDE